MPDIVQIKRGLKEHLPTEALEGELLLCTDTQELYVGINGEVQNVAMQSDILINSDIPMPITIGGLDKGTKFDNVPIADVIMQLLYPYAEPLTIITTNHPNLNESGVMLSGTTVTTKITRRMHNIKNVKLYRDGRALNTWSNLNVSFDAPTTLLYSDSVPLASDTTYEIHVEDDKKTTVSSLFIDFELPVFIGSCATLTPTSTEINGASKSIKKKANLYSYFTTNNSRMMLIYPASWGPLNNIKDSNQFDITNTFERKTIMHSTSAGSNSYYAYVSNLTTVNNFRVNFNF